MTTTVQRIARWIERLERKGLDHRTEQRVLVRVLDSLGCAIGALGYGPPGIIAEQVRAAGEPARGCTLIGGGRAAMDRATFHNGALLRYLDFMDSFLADGETCHPSDNFAGVLAACESARTTGRRFLLAYAIATELQCRMTHGAPIMANGFDHTTQLAYSVAAGAGVALGLRGDRLAHALALGGSDGCSLAVTRAVPVSQWKGLASADVAARAVQCASLAARGITGPLGIIEGPKGFEEALGERLKVDWNDASFRFAGKTLLKRHNAEVHSQTTLEAVLRLRAQPGFQARAVERVDVGVFRTAYAIIGGGEFGPKGQADTKEAADHDLRYLVAVALLDGEVTPRQFTARRLRSADVRRLMARVHVTHKRRYTWRYPDEMPARVVVRLRDGERLEAEQSDYRALVEMPWEEARAKFDRLLGDRAAPALGDRIAKAVEDLPRSDVGSLTGLLGKVRAPRTARRR